MTEPHPGTATRIALPGTDLSVSPLCLGTNRFGAELDRDATFALLDTLVEIGGNFIDTAGCYADWYDWTERSSSEKMIGRWRSERSDTSVVVATKGGHPRDGNLVPRLDRQTLMSDAKASRDHLRIDAIQLYYVHRDDVRVPVGEILSTLEDLKAEGVIRHYAASNWTGRRLAEAAVSARENGWHGFVAHQPEWSLARRNPGTTTADLLTADAETLAVHAELGLPLIPYSSQAKGYFDKIARAGHTSEEQRTQDQRALGIYDNPRNREIGAVLAGIAKRYDVTPTQIMLAYMRSLAPPVIPIVGCYSVPQLHQSWTSLGLELDADDSARIAEHVAA